MKQTFEINWSEGEIKEILVSSLLQEYLSKIGIPGTIIVTRVPKASTVFLDLSTISPESILVGMNTKERT